MTHKADILREIHRTALEAAARSALVRENAHAVRWTERGCPDDRVWPQQVIQGLCALGFLRRAGRDRVGTTALRPTPEGHRALARLRREGS